MNYLGIDVGSVSLAYVLIDEANQILQKGYTFHRGNILQSIEQELAAIDFQSVAQMAYNHSSSGFFSKGIVANEQVAAIEAIKFLNPDVRSLFSIGGETFGLYLFNDQGNYQKFISNSACAAGTGSFLDQQAERLGLADSAELSDLAESFTGTPPKIATRCAVFAKTDLVHNQQQGHSLAAISAGLCKGMAQNIADTLSSGLLLHNPVMAIGGVSRNKTVMHHLEQLTGNKIIVPDDAEIAPALGCAIMAATDKRLIAPLKIASIDDLTNRTVSEKSYFFPPLESELGEFPDFDSHTHYESENVEIDIYHLPKNLREISVFMGIDIGSTSTKAVLLEDNANAENILLGLYTRTKGQPVKAVQALLRVLREIEDEHGLHFDFRSVGTTGSGRKFVQKVINADLAVDEITAHARAAIRLNPETDTIIEIGGQDAKFTVLKNGQVTFSVMNYVCAAGTGSFIEEQAKRLNVPINEYARRAVGARSPLTSDRCTVFMERDLNHFLSQGYGKNELLAAALHSVRDNYLSKVAHLSKIGNVIYFQGATAKNKALVAAFEQKLQKPIFVSRYCHLTGALGVCLMLQEQQSGKSQFRGVDFYKETLIVKDDVCELCKNHCKLKEITIADEKVVWGYLCGRVEEDTKPKARNQSGFDLLSRRRQIFRPPSKKEKLPEKECISLLEEIKQFDFEASVEKLKQLNFDVSLETLSRFELEQSLEKLKENFSLNLLYLRHKVLSGHVPEIQAVKINKEIIIGLPNALYMLEYLPFWRFFFSLLGYSVVTSVFKEDYLNKGKEISGAEFCAPMSNWHGHVHSLAQRCDYLFLPHMLLDGRTDKPKFYCHFSNYASAVVQNLEKFPITQEVIDPLINFSKPALDNIKAIYESFPDDLRTAQAPNDIQVAYHQAWNWFSERRLKLQEIFTEQHDPQTDLSVVFLGRPYIIIDPVMNKNIPRIFNDLGVKTFFQDMIPAPDVASGKPGKELVDWNHWKFGDSILRTAEFVAETPGLYPVFLTAFKCAPDAFVLTYFKEIMDAYEKPYLILQLDEHGSGVGYETRIESAVRSFRSQLKYKQQSPQHPEDKKVHRQPYENGCVLIPNFDPLVSGLVSSAFEQAGYDARLIEESTDTVTSSLRLNDGQCLPISTIVQGAVDMIRKYNLQPQSTSLFINAITNMACNFPQYPLMGKKLLEQRGDGLEKVRIFATEFDMRSLPYELLFDVYSAYLLGGFLRKLACKIRPYEIVPGQTDQTIARGHDKLMQTIKMGLSKENAFRQIVQELGAIPVTESYGNRPKVTIIGDMYVRDNDVFNQNLVRDLEANGAEVITTPLSYMVRMMAEMRYYGLKVNGQYLNLMRNKLLMEVLESIERRHFQIANTVLREKFPVYDQTILDQLKKYKISLSHGGETAQNIIKIFSILQHETNISMIIHVNPIFCCAGMISEAFFNAIEKDIGIPIISITYDGTSSKRNDMLKPYLHFIKNKAGRAENFV
ncbi:MAG: hypothetical protein DWQ05_18535 [Calditrichaeota bacterium]|nr:MAG: hypothetical protein DWQ05_18535 [Calditrichota bacterium]